MMGEAVIVAASGPSLSAEVAAQVRLARWNAQCRVLAVNDAYRLMPWADALYAADEGWWIARNGARELLHGQRFSCAQVGFEAHTGKSDNFAVMFPNVQCVPARAGKHFSMDPSCIHYGEPEHSGFQAINLAILLGAQFIVLVGFDCRWVDGRSHFFGDHPSTLRQATDDMYRHMAAAYDCVNSPVEIVNATPDSAITRFPRVTLDEALQRYNSLCRHRAELDSRAD